MKVKQNFFEKKKLVLLYYRTVSKPDKPLCDNSYTQIYGNIILMTQIIKEKQNQGGGIL